MTGVLIKQGKFEHRHTHTDTEYREDEGTHQGGASSRRGRTKIASEPPGARTLQLSEGTNRANT